MPRRFTQDRDGQALNGSLLVPPAQGLGDEIFCSGMLNDLRPHAQSPVLEQPAIDFVDLQYGNTSDEQAALRAARGLTLRRIAEIDNFNDIDGLAALIEACDVIVTVSNTTAHLAAAMGKPVLVMLLFSPGLMWYWHIDHANSVWYPRARLFRQDNIGDWNPVIARVRDALFQQSRKPI